MKELLANKKTQFLIFSVILLIYIGTGLILWGAEIMSMLKTLGVIVVICAFLFVGLQVFKAKQAEKAEKARIKAELQREKIEAAGEIGKVVVDKVTNNTGGNLVGSIIGLFSKKK